MLEHLKINGFEKRNLTEFPDSVRLRFETIKAEHAEAMFALNADPEVVRYTGDVAFEDVAAAQQFIENYSAYKDFGIGRWLVTEKSSGEILGWCGLKYIAELDEVDLGYRFYQKYWNQGYATEAARATLGFGFNTLEIPVIIGRAMPENSGSVRVLQKIGMTFQGTAIEHDGEDVVVYAAFKANA